MAYFLSWKRGAMRTVGLGSLDHTVRTISPVRTGLVLAAVIGLWHLSWSLLVALGWAQPFIDFIFWLHFLKPVYVVQAFDPVRAMLLVAVTALFGFIVGSVFGLLWNWSRRTMTG